MKDPVCDIFAATLHAVRREGHPLPFVVSKHPVSQVTLGKVVKLCHKQAMTHFGMGGDPYTLFKHMKMCNYINMVVQTVNNHLLALIHQPLTYERNGPIYDVVERT